jgi:hypothetical protein
MDLTTDFEWQRSAAGYDFVPAGVRDPRWPDNLRLPPIVEYPSGTLVQLQNALRGARPSRNTSAEAVPPESGSVEPFHRIVPREGEFISYRPAPGLAWVFASKARTPEGLLEFVNDYGPLTLAGNRQGEDIRLGLSEATEMYRLLKLPSEERSAYFSRWSSAGMLIGSGLIFLTSNKAGLPQIKLGGQISLRSALWLEIAHDVSGVSLARECAFCGTLFNAGPGTGRQASAKFCSDPHRIAYNSRKRPRKSQR